MKGDLTDADRVWVMLYKLSVYVVLRGNTWTTYRVA